jgi:hypothetical protein
MAFHPPLPLDDVRYPLSEYAMAFGAHPRTIMRHIYGDPNPYWAPDYNPDILIEVVAEGFGCNAAMLNKVLRRKDRLMLPKEASEFLNVKHSTFLYRQYALFVNRPRFPRYLRSKLTEEHMKRYK